ncbi:S1 family peptidase [Cohnella herbarum]|uniref:Trypsin-like peptidase domain-containing protein n=1 Tax=Cohnella herbarum TaxID=2728023 RepID=A0A7Z2VK04_9BACL|nr:serine protease [Cohnella herbarum]QJD84598.1 trypsin-like peptidase domain-containing protein [Cohnella herbarum]
MKQASKRLWLFVGLVCLFLSQVPVSGAEDRHTYDSEGIYELAQHATLYVRVYRADGTIKDVGTGFMIDKEGKALTAYHVVEGAERISVVMNDGTVVEPVTVTAENKEQDIAVLKLPASGSPSQAGYRYLNLRSGKTKHGERIFALGYPMKETKIITEGIVSSPRAPINGRDRILITAQVASGMSGGPVLDKNGDVVGVISGSLRTMNNIHLVVDMDAVRSVIKQHHSRRGSDEK